MLSFYNIWTVSKFEIKTLWRSWFFRIFAILSLALLFLFNLIAFTDVTGGFIWRFLYGMTSSIPYSNLLMLNLAQAVITIFLASDFLKRDKKLDTTEAIYIRSISNSDYVLGKTFGILVIFFVLDFIVMLMAAVFNVINLDAQFNIFIYFYYFLLLSLPTLIFITGFAFLLMTLIRNQAVTFIVLLGYIGVTLLYLGPKFYSAFDYIGFSVPMMYSDFVGFGNIGNLILQRGAYILFGLSFIFFTMYMFKRLPQSETMRKFNLILTLIFLFGGAGSMIYYIGNFQSGENLRTEMINLNNEHVSDLKITVVQNDISLRHKGSTIECTSDIIVKNNNEKSVSKFILNLNPSLEIKSITSGGGKVEFSRNIHLITVNLSSALKPEETKGLSIAYSGGISEEAAYLDINEDKRNQMRKMAYYTIDKKYAFVTPGYLLLTEENMWYPKSGTTFSPEAQFSNNVEFTNFSLKVETKENLLAVSQGEYKSPSPGIFEFKPEVPLPKLSLNIGPYVVNSIEVDSIKYNLLNLEKHDYYKNYLDEINDTLTALIRELKQDYERDISRTYPYQQFSIVEVPAQFTGYQRMWTTAHEQSQPQIVMLPENGVEIDDADFKQRERMQERFGNRSNQVVLPKENQSNMFNRFVRNTFMNQSNMFRFRSDNDNNTTPGNPYKIFPNFYYYTNNLSSSSLPVFNKIIENYLDVKNDNSGSPFMRAIMGLNPTEKAAQILNDKSFAEIISDTTYNKYLKEILNLKGSYLFTQLESEIGKSNLRDLINRTLNENKFSTSGYSQFVNSLNEEYGINLEEMIEDWFNNSQLPGYFITKIKGYKVVSDNRERYQINFNITNSEPVEGFVKITFEPRRGGPGGGRGFGFMSGGGDEETSIAEKVIQLMPGQTKQISSVLDESPGRMSVNTILSKNLPLEFDFPFEEFEENSKAEPFDGETILDEPEAFVSRDEIIVDNEDPGFEVKNPEETSLLKKLFSLEQEGEKYVGLQTWNPPEDWRATIISESYGKYVHSVHYTESGDGSTSAAWNVEIPQSGYYEVYTYISKPRIPGRRGRNSDNSKQEYHYTVTHDDGDEEVILDFSNADEGWNLLGSFYLSEGSSKVSLSNKSSDGLIMADAIKWINRK
ncbi:MAG: hypothetical protein K9J16_10490 [Melioribacteraceae bacterium]|nr:hypothetical protein [Melioribacteraceae bacterium]MCF8354466.1 hypothetical protein [Melioribacteraceae bacterium]MCF8394076.1 hypothetical protein [Melioribacteraceae bacterium]MCF8419871.1 hypothetical protein [Melioribacteraceae bacterium]